MAYNWLRFEGFDDASWSDHWWTVAGSSLVAGPDGRGQALRGTGITETPIFVPQSAPYTIGVRVFPRTAGSSFLFGNYGGARQHWKVEVSESGWSLWRAPYTMVASGSWSAGWHYVECQWRVANTGVLRFAVDGVEEFSSADIDTYQTTLGYLNWNHAAADIDDFYMHNSSDAADRLGPIFVSKLLPSGAGFNSGFTGSDYTKVDDAVPSTAASVTASTSGVKDSYAFGDLPFAASAVHAVAVNTHTKGGGRLMPLVRSAGGSEANGQARYHPADWREHRHVLLTNPVTTLAWTVSDVDGSEFGIETV